MRFSHMLRTSLMAMVVAVLGFTVTSQEVVNTALDELVPEVIAVAGTNVPEVVAPKAEAPAVEMPVLLIVVIVPC